MQRLAAVDDVGWFARVPIGQEPGADRFDVAGSAAYSSFWASRASITGGTFTATTRLQTWAAASANSPFPAPMSTTEQYGPRRPASYRRQISSAACASSFAS
jgi:hypothetical protein